MWPKLSYNRSILIHWHCTIINYAVSLVVLLPLKLLPVIPCFKSKVVYWIICGEKYRIDQYGQIKLEKVFKTVNNKHITTAELWNNRLLYLPYETRIGRRREWIIDFCMFPGRNTNQAQCFHNLNFRHKNNVQHSWQYISHASVYCDAHK